MKDKESGKILGFESISFQNNFQVALQQAIRVDPSLRGEGLGKKLNELGMEYIKKLNPQVSRIEINIQIQISH